MRTARRVSAPSNEALDILTTSHGQPQLAVDENTSHLTFKFALSILGYFAVGQVWGDGNVRPQARQRD